jgi:hypothetical protein
MYSGNGNDINQASYKLSKIALRNTPAKNPKEYKTTAEREAEKNEGKVASITNLLDEMDTTIYVINDKLDDLDLDEEDEDSDDGEGLEGGMKIAPKKKASILEKVTNDFLSQKLKELKLSSSGKKDVLLARLLQHVSESDIIDEYNKMVEEYNESIKPKEIETQTSNETGEMETQTAPQMVVDTGTQTQNPEDDYYTLLAENQRVDPYDKYYTNSVDGDAYDVDDREQSRFDGYDTLSSDEETTDFIQNMVNSGEVEQHNTIIHPFGARGVDERKDNDDTYFAQEDDDLEGQQPEPEQQPDGGDNDDNSVSEEGIDGSLKSDLNSNVMKLEEQVNRLSRLTKGLNTAINYSSSIEAQSLNSSNQKLISSNQKTMDYLNRIPNIHERFDTKMKSILNKILNQYNIIQSALGGYSGEYIQGGSFLSASLVPIATQLMRRAGREENLAYLNSSRKRFY